MKPVEEPPASSAFKRAHARYRRQPHATDRLDDLDELVDFSRSGDDRILPIQLEEHKNVDYYRGPVYGLKDFPGYLYAPQSLSESLQAHFVRSAVSQYCEAPHVTNIDAVPPKPSEEDNTNESMWELWKRENGFVGDQAATSGTTKASHGANKKKYKSFRKLSWATMGYNYDWTARAYNENRKSPMPVDVERVAKLFAETASLAEGCKPPVQYTASACIVNFYHGKVIMGGHVDDLEISLDKPIVSLSMGRPAVFLLGGKTKDCTPIVPILVRPGDVMIMGGESRLYYHSMARLLPAHELLPPVDATLIPLAAQRVSVSSADEDENVEEVSPLEQKAMAAFLQGYRVNISARQVYPYGDDNDESDESAERL